VNRKAENITIKEIYKIFKEIERSEIFTQRDFADRMGYSLGKMNYLLKSLTQKGLIKIENFSKSHNKMGYRYVLTPHGIAEKYKVTADFLKRKEAEFIEMQVEIEELRGELL